MNNYSNNKPQNPFGFKEETKIKYNTVNAVTRWFLNGTAAMMTFLGAEISPIDWAGYCQLTPAKQLTWKERGDDLKKSIIFLMNSKNDNAKK